MKPYTPLSTAFLSIAIGFASLAGITISAQAQTLPSAETDVPEAPATPSFKLTSGIYNASGGEVAHARGVDLNLRYSGAPGDLWLGVYRSPELALSQTRAGWDSTFHWGAVRFMPSLQAASGGFWGGSVGWETGEHWFVGAGLGRTNLRSYVNLNYDPNDAWMLSGGYRWGTERSLALQMVRDNRQNPDQQHVHGVYRTALPEGQRLTLDMLYKKGLVDGAPIRRTGLSVTYDWPRIFVRMAYDPKVNFTAQDMTRLSVGTRF